MDLKHIRDELRHYLHKGWFRQHTRYADLVRLIEALEKKETDLEQRLEAEKDPLKRRHLKIELKVTRMQRAKGIKRRNELKTGSTPDHAPPTRTTVAGVID